MTEPSEQQLFSDEIAVRRITYTTSSESRLLRFIEDMTLTDPLSTQERSQYVETFQGRFQESLSQLRHSPRGKKKGKKRSRRWMR